MICSLVGFQNFAGLSDLLKLGFLNKDITDLQNEFHNLGQIYMIVIPTFKICGYFLSLYCKNVYIPRCREFYNTLLR